MKRSAFLLVILLLDASVRADTVLYEDSPNSYVSVRNTLLDEYAASSIPPVTESTQPYYQVLGNGPVDLRFRYVSQKGLFLFQVGYYHRTAALRAIDTSTDAGRIAYAREALAPGNAVLLFDESIANPGDINTSTLNGGDVIGFFLIPDEKLVDFQFDRVQFAIEGVGSARLDAPPPYRWPLFTFVSANPQGLDQSMSFSGESIVSGGLSNLITWEDLTRASIPKVPMCPTISTMMLSSPSMAPWRPFRNQAVHGCWWPGSR